MSRRGDWRVVLDAEVQRWSALSFEQLVSELRDLVVYEVDAASKKYQVEVQILEKTGDYAMVMVAVDDGSLPASLSPSTQTFICRKTTSTV